MSTPVEKIKERLSIVDVVSEYVELKKSGRHYKGKSPFSSEKTPSFFVSPDRGVYYCFSTNKGGDIFTITQELEGVDFKGALKLLAEKAGVEIAPENPQERSEREALFAALEYANVFYEETLRQKKDVQTYLKERGVEEKTIAAWRIGCAPHEWRSLKDHLNKKDIPEDIQTRAGLIKKTEDSASSYDVFRNRVMFPICDNSGRVVAFSGRALDTSDPNIPKYVNSPETELYKKSEILFGYHKAKQGIRTYDFSLIVEGQFDLVLAHQAGFSNTVAISGTALTHEHIRFLSQLSTKTVLALDSDRAGIASMKRAAGLMIASGMDVKIARIPEGKDPADLVQEDPKHLKEAIKHAVHVVPFLVEHLRAIAKDERAFRLRVREEVIPLIAQIGNKIDREFFEETVAESINATKDAIHFEVERFLENSEEKEGRASFETLPHEDEGVPHEDVKKEERKEHLSYHLLAIMLWQEALSESMIDTKKMREHFKDALGESTFEDLQNDEENTLLKRYLFEVESRYGEEKEENVKSIVSEMLRDVSLLRLRRELKDLRGKLLEAEGSGSEDEMERLLRLCSDVQKSMSTRENENPYVWE